jgi:hypothetical protein
MSAWWWAIPFVLGAAGFARGLWVAVREDRWSAAGLVLCLLALCALYAVGAYQQSHEGHGTTTHALGCDGWSEQ